MSSLRDSSAAPDLAGMSDDEKLEAMVQWFHENFEDPVHSMPYNSREGGYLYIRGGPYAAGDVLEDAFTKMADFELIQAAAQQIEGEDGIYDWAPSTSQAEPDEDDYDFDARNSDAGDLMSSPTGEDQVSALHQDKTALVLERLDKIEKLLLEYPQAGIGHNNPPEALEGVPITSIEVQNLHVTINNVRSEVKLDFPDTQKVAEQATVLKRIADKILSWMSQSIDSLVVGAVVVATTSYYPALSEALLSAFEAVKAWLM